jgi:spore germination cell wall hydrolase CwlJ-like protein
VKTLKYILFTTLLVFSAIPAAASNVVSKAEIMSQAETLRQRVPNNLYRERELSCIAIAVYHEARGENIHGQMAVASVILQRAKTPGRWGTSACDVVRPIQFSFMRSRWGFPPIREMDAWMKAIDVAEAIMLSGPLPELKGADHYHATYVSPDWARKLVKIGKIGTHVFYASDV